MRRGLVHAMAWSLSTGAAVTLSWWGVHTVMSGTAYDRPRAVPINPNTPTRQAKPQVSETHRPPVKTAQSSPSNTSGAARTSRPPVTEPRQRPSRTPRPAAQPSTPAAPKPSGTMKGYTVDGGRVVFDVGPTSASLASATPNAGWEVAVWEEPMWIRVTFTKDGREDSVFYTWNGTAPRVQFHKSP
ncbi:hypothetical protein ACFYT4_13615 [Streptomyces sp. NPDC004609]|uniref:hypothetical protein n=1 Tax=Streptomyces sp. NPDC004609 TaxID=3364704 RepID=UPI0036A9EF9C